MRLNPIQFNVYLGICTILGFIISNSSFDINLPTWLIAIIALLLYIGDFWAFIYKLRLSRVRMIFELSEGNPKKKVADQIEPGCMMFYAFMMRMIFRIMIAMLFILGFGGSLGKDMNGFQMGCLITLVLFELVNMLYSLYDTHIFDPRSSDYDDYSEKEYWEKEVNWRTKMFKKLMNENSWKKELAANFILFVMALILTHLFWGNMNKEFIESIVRAEKFGDSLSFQIIGILISTIVLCFFFLFPIRLAFWVEARMKADSPPERRKYRWSIVFAGLTIISPTLIQIMKTLF